MDTVAYNVGCLKGFLEIFLEHSLERSENFLWLLTRCKSELEFCNNNSFFKLLVIPINR